MLYQQLVPPIAKTLLRKILPPIKVYKDYERIQNALKKYQGYDSDALIDIVLHKTKKYIENLHKEPPLLENHHLFLLTILGIIANKSKLKVLDFGGAFGTHYFIAKTFFPEHSFEWTVIELPQVVQRAEVLKNAELTFLDLGNDFTQKFEVDLVLTSGTLQHMPQPMKALAFLTAQQAPFLALLRLGLNMSFNDVWVIHKARFQDCGPGAPLNNCQNELAAFSFCMMSAQKFDECLSAYQLKLSNVDNSGILSVPDYQIRGFNRLYQQRS